MLVDGVAQVLDVRVGQVDAPVFVFVVLAPWTAITHLDGVRRRSNAEVLRVSKRSLSTKIPHEKKLLLIAGGVRPAREAGGKTRECLFCCLLGSREPHNVFTGKLRSRVDQSYSLRCRRGPRKSHARCTETEESSLRQVVRELVILLKEAVCTLSLPPQIWWFMLLSPRVRL